MSVSGERPPPAGDPIVRDRPGCSPSAAPRCARSPRSTTRPRSRGPGSTHALVTLRKVLPLWAVRLLVASLLLAAGARRASTASRACAAATSRSARGCGGSWPAAAPIAVALRLRLVPGRHRAAAGHAAGARGGRGDPAGDRPGPWRWWPSCSSRCWAGWRCARRCMRRAGARAGPFRGASAGAALLVDLVRAWPVCCGCATPTRRPCSSRARTPAGRRRPRTCACRRWPSASSSSPPRRSLVDLSTRAVRARLPHAVWFWVLLVAGGVVPIGSGWVIVEPAVGLRGRGRAGRGPLRRPRERDPDEITVRGPVSYAGPGSPARRGCGSSRWRRSHGHPPLRAPSPSAARVVHRLDRGRRAGAGRRGDPLLWQEPIRRCATRRAPERPRPRSCAGSRPPGRRDGRPARWPGSTPSSGAVAFLARSPQRRTAHRVTRSAACGSRGWTRTSRRSIVGPARGAGTFDGTSLPGGRRDRAIAGHRTTYGAPFRHLDALAPRRPHHAPDALRDVPLRASQRPRIVAPRPFGVRRVGHDRLVLRACHPLFSAAQSHRGLRAAHRSRTSRQLVGIPMWSRVARAADQQPSDPMARIASMKLAATSRTKDRPRPVRRRPHVVAEALIRRVRARARRRARGQPR